MTNRPRFAAAGLIFCFLLGLAAPAAADEGRMPIWARGPLNQDGKYVLTRNLPPGPGPAIDIPAGIEHVDIDLNGFTVFGDPAGGTVIQGLGFHRSVTIRNGEVRGQGGPGAGIHLVEVEKVVIEDVKVIDAGDAGIFLQDVFNFALRRNIVVAANADGIVADNSGAGVIAHGSIEDNIVRDCGGGIAVVIGASIGVTNNRIESTFAVDGIRLESVNAALVANNTVQNAGAAGILLRGISSSKFHNNVVTKSIGDGFFIDGGSSDNLFLDNVSSSNNGSGMVVEGRQNQFDRNVLNTNGLAGLHILNGSTGNTYGRNMARANGAAPGPCTNPATACGAPDYCEDNAVPSGNSSFNDNFAPVGC